MEGTCTTWPTLSKSQSHLATAKLTSRFSLCWGGWVLCVSPAPGMRRDLGVVATVSHLQKAHWVPSSPSTSTRLTYSARDEGPSASQACQPCHGGGRDSAFSSAAGPAKGSCVGEEGGGALRGSPAVFLRPLVSYLGVGRSVGFSPVQAPGSPFS